MGGLRVLGAVPNRSEVLYGEARILAQPGAVVLWGIGDVNVFNVLASADHTAASARAHFYVDFQRFRTDVIQVS